jgi:DNA-binding NarL/FixJ family response regulator
MTTSDPADERPADKAGLSDATATVCGLIADIARNEDPAVAVDLLREASHALGAESAVFVSFIRDDATLSSYRHLSACDPKWAVLYARDNWFIEDPWLRHALHSTEPVLAHQLPLHTERQKAMAASAAELGFRSALIMPAPSAAAQSRVGMLCLGSDREHQFSADGLLRVLARSLAMELNQWWHRRIKGELIARARITDHDLTLLRLCRDGHSSKAIASQLGTQAKTIDCRIQRMNHRLGMADRQSAVRLAEIYGLI